MRLIFTRCLQAINGIKKLLVSKVSIDVNGYITGRVADDSADQPLIYAGSGHHRDHCMPGVMRSASSIIGTTDWYTEEETFNIESAYFKIVVSYTNDATIDITLSLAVMRSETRRAIMQ